MSQRNRSTEGRRGYREERLWVTIATAATLAGLQLYEELGPAWAGNTPAAPSLVITGLLVVGIGTFFTDYWHPVLYLLGAGVGLYVFVVWLFGGTELDPTSLGTAGSAALLAALCLANVYLEGVMELRDQPARGPQR